jgi:hypothetical protein
VKFESDENTLYILRPGIISADDLLKICEPLGVKIKSGTAQSAPGQLKAHYQPEVPLVLEMTDETQLTPQREMNLNKLLDQKALRWRPLYLERDPSMAARTLYSQLRERSQNKSEGIWLPLSPLLKKDSRWEMIFDRLERAASLVL